MEGSTQLLRRLGDRYPGALADVERLLRDVCSAHGGELVDTQGDAHFFAFRTPGAGLAAAVDAQRALASPTLAGSAEIRVRIGLHTGAAASQGSRYYGVSVHRAARISATAHGGQVIVSEETAAVLRGDETSLDGIVLTDLGRFVLKDFEHPVRLYEATADGLLTDLPPPNAPPADSTKLRRFLLVTGVAVAAASAAIVAAVVFAGNDGPGGVIEIEGGSVSLIDPADRSAIASVDVDFVFSPESSQAALGKKSLWLADREGATLVEIDTTAHEIVQTVGVGQPPLALAVYRDELWYWHSDGVSVAVPERRDVLSAELSADNNLKDYVSISTGAGAVWASHKDDLWKIDPDTDKVAEPISLDDYATATAVGGDTVWIAGASDYLSTTDTSGSGAVVSQLLESGTQPGQGGTANNSAMIVTDHDVWVASERLTTLWHIDPASTQQTASRVISGRSSLAWDGTSLWLTSEFEPELLRLDPTTLDTIETIPVSQPARLLAADERGLWLYARPSE